MNAELDITRRAVACPKWRWMPGMRVIVPPKHDGATGFSIRLGEYGYVPAPHEYPDFTDPATLGCLLALVREAWNDPTLGVSAARGGRSGRPAGCWHFHGRKPHRRGFGRRFTGDFFFAEAAALVAALEAAP